MFCPKLKTTDIMGYIGRGKKLYYLPNFSIWPNLELGLQVSSQVREVKNSNSDGRVGKLSNGEVSPSIALIHSIGSRGEEGSLWSQDFRCPEISIRKAEREKPWFWIWTCWCHASRTIQVALAYVRREVGQRYCLEIVVMNWYFKTWKSMKVIWGEQVEWE